jgi:hypothetical protein
VAVGARREVRIWPKIGCEHKSESSDKLTWIGVSRNTPVQICGSLLIAAATCGFNWVDSGSLASTPFTDLSAFHSFVFGVAIVYAITGPVPFGFLMQELQGCREEQADIYWKLSESVSELRDCVAGMSENGRIHYRISDRLLNIEIIRLDKIDGLDEIRSVFADLHKMADWVIRKKSGQRWNEEQAKILCSLNRVEERLSMLGRNFIRRVCVKVLQDSVMKCLWCVGGLVLISVLALGFYNSLSQSLFFFAAAALASFGIFITLELATLAAQEVREVTPRTIYHDAEDDEFNEAIREAS